MVNPLIMVIVFFVVFLLLDSKSQVLSNIFLFGYFLWGYVNIEGSTSLATFYLFAILFVIIVNLTKQNFSIKDSSNTQGWSFKSFKIPLISFIVGILIFAFMTLLQSKSPGAIIGVPTLALASGTFYASQIGMLGIIENRLFFSVYELFSLYPVTLGFLTPLVPVLSSASIFAVFHLSAYGLALSSLLFALIVFSIWIISYIILRDDLASNLAHFLWNVSVVLGSSLAIGGVFI